MDHFSQAAKYTQSTQASHIGNITPWNLQKCWNLKVNTMQLDCTKINVGIFDTRFRERGIPLNENPNYASRAEVYWINMVFSFTECGKSWFVILSSIALLTWRTGPPQVASHPCCSAEWRGSGSLFGIGPPLSEGSNRALLRASAPWGHLKENHSVIHKIQ